MASPKHYAQLFTYLARRFMTQRAQFLKELDKHAHIPVDLDIDNDPKVSYQNLLKQLSPPAQEELRISGERFAAAAERERSRSAGGGRMR